MTIYDIKRLTLKTEPRFFSRDILRFFGQTMEGWRVRKQPDGRFEISQDFIDSDRLVSGTTTRYFNPRNRKLEEE